MKGVLAIFLATLVAALAMACSSEKKSKIGYAPDQNKVDAVKYCSEILAEDALRSNYFSSTICLQGCCAKLRKGVKE